jgi:hypothetical protein
MQEPRANFTAEELERGSEEFLKKHQWYWNMNRSVKNATH